MTLNSSPGFVITFIASETTCGSLVSGPFQTFHWYYKRIVLPVSYILSIFQEAVHGGLNNLFIYLYIIIYFCSMLFVFKLIIQGGATSIQRGVGEGITSIKISKNRKTMESLTVNVVQFIF